MLYSGRGIRMWVDNLAWLR